MVRLSPPGQTLFCESVCRLADRRGLKQGCNPFKDPVHAQVGVDGGVDGVMVGASVHDQNLRALVSLFDHVRQVMSIFLG